MLLPNIIFCWLFCSVGSYYLKSCNESVSSLQLCKLDPSYAKGQPDYKWTGQPMMMETQVIIHSLTAFDEKSSTITLSVLLTSLWNDTRLSLKAKDDSNQWYEVSSLDAEHIFSPSFRVLKAKSVERERKYGPKDSDYFWFQLPHNLEYRQLLRIVLYCTFDFGHFPFDTHSCDFVYGSVGPSIVSLILKGPLITIEPGLSITNNLAFDVNIEPLKPFYLFEKGYNKSYNGLRIHLERAHRSKIMSSFYGLTLVFSILSLVSFAINADAVPGRLGLLVTLCLINTNIYGTLETPNEGFGFVEIWMLGVMSPIFIAIIEYGIILSMKKYSCRKTRFDLEILADRWTCAASTVLFILFNIAYWSFAFLY